MLRAPSALMAAAAASPALAAPTHLHATEPQAMLPAAEAPSAVRSQGDQSAPTVADADLSRLFDGRVLKDDPSLLNGLNEGGSARLMLTSEVDARRRPLWVSLDLSLLKNAPQLLRESWTVPNRQDYAYLATKTFGLNLALRLFFAVAAMHDNNLSLMRAVISTTWYQLQDASFTLFGQTYMKFIGRMTGLLRIGRGYFGDFLFTYMQLTAFEFLNRLVLGPIGENPLVYTWSGLGLVFTNVFLGMISGGPLIPAINKMRRAGVISQSTMMHLYQLASLTMQFGLLASFGYQRLYFMLTTATLLLSWGAYAFFALFDEDKPDIHTRLDGKTP